jgi:phosphonate transport system substrate-binding protein
MLVSAHRFPARSLASCLRALLGLAFLLAGITLVSPAAAADKVIIALKPDKNPEQMLAEKTALERFLGQQLGKPVETVIPLSAAVIVEGLASGAIDAGYLSATDMVHATDRGHADLLLAGQFGDGRAAYDSYWVVKREAPYQSIADLRGRPVAFASRTSTSGFVIPLLDLQRRQLLDSSARPESFFGRGNVFFGVGYVSAIERVLAGEAEAAAVSYYVLDLDKHLTPEQRGRLRMLQRQGPVPSHVIAVRRSLGAADRAALERAFLALNEPANQELRDKLFTTALVPAEVVSHLGDLRTALQLAQRALQK